MSDLEKFSYGCYLITVNLHHLGDWPYCTRVTYKRVCILTPNTRSCSDSLYLCEAWKKIAHGISSCWVKLMHDVLVIHSAQSSVYLMLRYRVMNCSTKPKTFSKLSTAVEEQQHSAVVTVNCYKRGLALRVIKIHLVWRDSVDIWKEKKNKTKSRLPSFRQVWLWGKYWNAYPYFWNKTIPVKFWPRVEPTSKASSI